MTRAFSTPLAYPLGRTMPAHPEGPLTPNGRVHREPEPLTPRQFWAIFGTLCAVGVPSLIVGFAADVWPLALVGMVCVVLVLLGVIRVLTGGER